MAPCTGDMIICLSKIFLKTDRKPEENEFRGGRKKFGKNEEKAGHSENNVL